ncbi:hypothetical protein ACQ4PT_014089 [Festuca glaucescens]
MVIFLNRSQNFGAVNGSLITLLPKKDGAVELKDFRPISLVHSFAKLVAKILALRLAPKLPELVDANQSTFVRGRCIHDNFVSVQQSARSLFRFKVPSLLLKLNIARAFDSVSWSFLISVLRQRGFGPRWIAWVSLLLSSASTRVLVNGCPGEPFAHGRGLRQGDPISPLLFIIVMNVVSAMFSASEQRGLLSDLKQFGIRHRVSLYANDVVIFAKPTAHELEVVVGILDCFGAASRLIVNYAKSIAIPIRCTPGIILRIAPSLPCPLGQFPCKYLGLPLSLTKLRKGDVQPMIDKLALKLPFWKARLLTREGRIAYVQVVLTSSVIYQMLALDLEPWVLQLVDRLRRGFLWAGKEDTRGGHCLVAWHKAAVRIEVGTGDRILFWEHPWVDGLSVAALAPAVLKLVCPGPARSRTVQQGLRDNAWVRDIGGVLTVDAVVQYLRLWHLIQSVHVRADTPDVFSWKFSASGEFATRPSYVACFARRTALR